jgi:PPOX class probable FMN-dependent enzyme
MFQDVVETEADLRELYRQPQKLTQAKVRPSLDQHARRFISNAPFVLIGTSNPNGTADVSPKGGPAGFVVVLDDNHLAIPDLQGNNLLDSITNIVNGSGIGLLFLIPGVEETLRVNGRSCLTTDAAVLDACAVKDRRPKAAIGVTVVEQFMHCAKAFRRSELWQPDTWPDRSVVATLGCIVKDQIPEVGDVDAATIDKLLEDGYQASMWEPGGSQ